MLNTERTISLERSHTRKGKKSMQTNKRKRVGLQQEIVTVSLWIREKYKCQRRSGTKSSTIAIHKKKRVNVLNKKHMSKKSRKSA